MWFAFVPCFLHHSTKQVSRFHPPYVLEVVKLLAVHTDQLRIIARSAWNEFLIYVCTYRTCSIAPARLADQLFYV